MLKGIDISAWQKDDYQILIDRYATDFVIARCSYGNWVDPFCDRIIQYAKSKDKLTGVYFFALTLQQPDAKLYAKWCYEQVKGYIGNCAFFLDWEKDSKTDISDIIWCLEWCKEFERLTGVKPLIYMSSAVEMQYNWAPLALNDNGLWLANWGINDGNIYLYNKPRYWSVVAFHQYTSKLNRMSLDGDVFNGDREAFMKYQGVTKSKPEISVPATPRELKVGDRVRLLKLKDYRGTKLVQYQPTYVISQISKDKKSVVLNDNEGVFARMKINDVERV